MESLLNVRSVPEGTSSCVKVAPSIQEPLAQIYNPSEDGIDENLLILMHGLGDTHLPFATLGKQLHLPQTATLSIRASEKVPYLYEEAYQWYESFDSLGELLVRPNPTRVLELLERLLNHLVQECWWSPANIHLFGFGQGGGLAAELGLRWDSRDVNNGRLGSIVTVAGPLLSYPTPSSPCTTPILVFHRPASRAGLSSGDVRAFKKGYKSVQEVKVVKGDGMPRSKEEWEPIMCFWSSNLSKRNRPGMYEVLGGS